MIKIPVEVSARHIHISKKDLDILFGNNYELTPVRYLSMANEFLSKEKLDIKYNDRIIKNVSILGPVRKESQIEISKTDTFSLKCMPPIAESGELKNSLPIKLINPINGNEISLNRGLIIAKRHIHMTEEDAKNLNITNKQIVNVLIKSDSRTTVYLDVVVRASDRYVLSMHIDTDEANASDTSNSSFATIINDIKI